ncbi:MAG: ribosome assembly cofactor RimP [Spirochaetaceae bacterium]|nr:ribosome assembly cofactor RimP [Spirochaetaceae bacterium]
MRYRLKEDEPGGENGALASQLKGVVEALGLFLVSLTVSRHKGGVQVRAAVFKRGGVSIGDCAGAHRAMMPPLELAFGGGNLSVEVSSPGINRLVKDGAEFRHYIGCPVKCWVTGLSDWKAGVLEEVAETHIIIKGKTGMEKILFESIAKAKLDSKAAR